MALDYVTNPTGVFYRAGKLIGRLNSYAALASTTYPADLKTITDPYEAADLTALVSRLYADYTGFQDQVMRVRQTLAGYVTATLADRATVLDQVGLLSGAGVAQVLPALRRQMQADAQAVKKCTVTIGAPAAVAGNVGGVNVFTVARLDGVSPPRRGGPADPSYLGALTELAVPSETMTLQCISSARADGEAFSWNGANAFGDLDWRGEGSGQGPGLTVLNAGNYLANGTFESWSVANTPDGWGLGAGTLVGTHVFQETGAGNFYRGTSAVKLIGNASLATVELSQALPVTRMTPRTAYALAVAVKASAAGTVGKDVQITPSGTGYTPGADEKVVIAGGSLPTGWTVYGVSFRTPAVIPPDLAVKVQLTGTPAATPLVYVDMAVVGPVVYHGGVGAFVVSGAAAPAVGDRYTFSVANDGAGVWQSFWRRWFKAQLPSVTAGAETISDTLAV
jgi:hypothetical protein